MRIFSIIAAVVVLVSGSILIIGCVKEDNLENRINNIEEELSAQRQLIESLKLNVTIIDIVEGEGTYTIILSNGNQITLHDGMTPVVIIGSNSNWFINGVDTGISSKGKDADSISIGPNGNWFISDIDTGIKATPLDGKDAPYITSIIESVSTWTFSFSDGSQIIVQKEVSGTDAYYVDSPQFGNSMATFGGSVCEMAITCRDYWSKKLNLTITNYSTSGSGFATPTKTIMEQVNRACENEMYDIYLFWCSTNDLPYTVGDINDYYEWNPSIIESKASQTGGINWCIKRIYESNPKAKIVFFTSLRQFSDRGYKTTSSDEKTWLFQLVDAQIACCKYYGIPYLDQFYTCPFNVYNYTYYYKDATHPNEKGYDMIMRKQALFIAEAY